MLSLFNQLNCTVHKHNIMSSFIVLMSTFTFLYLYLLKLEKVEEKRVVASGITEPPQKYKYRCVDNQ